jgi:hypothetical protein
MYLKIEVYNNNEFTITDKVTLTFISDLFIRFIYTLIIITLPKI